LDKDTTKIEGVIGMKECWTKGGVIVNNIEVGDIHYESEYGCYIECEVLTKPERIESKSSFDDSVQIQWSWTSKNNLHGKVINYLITEGFAHYGPNLSNEMRFIGYRQI
jgi:hypothetical protein